MKIFKIFKKEKKVENKGYEGIFEDLRNRAIVELANFLVKRWHFGLDEALSASEEFWKKYEKKITEVMGIG